MQTFKGFVEPELQTGQIPEQFFHELLGGILHLGELKTTLYFLWRFNHMEGTFRYLRRIDIAVDSQFMDGLGETPEDAGNMLDESLELMVMHGILLKADLHCEGEQERLFFLNSPKGQAAVKAIQDRNWRHTAESQKPFEIIQEKINIFGIYEENIGPLTPMIAESLGEAEITYPHDWIEDAFRIAVENNKRNWRYVEAILMRWKQEGRDERKDRRDIEKSGRDYIEGKYADYIEH
jgi:DNA replication protein